MKIPDDQERQALQDILFQMIHCGVHLDGYVDWFCSFTGLSIARLERILDFRHSPIRCVADYIQNIMHGNLFRSSVEGYREKLEAYLEDRGIAEIAFDSQGGKINAIDVSCVGRADIMDLASDMFDICGLDFSDFDHALCQLFSGNVYGLIPYILRQIPDKKPNTCEILYGRRWSNALRTETKNVLLQVPKAFVKHIARRFISSYVIRESASSSESGQRWVVYAQDTDNDMLPPVLYAEYKTLDALIEDGWVVD